MRKVLAVSVVSILVAGFASQLNSADSAPPEEIIAYQLPKYAQVGDSQFEVWCVDGLEYFYRRNVYTPNLTGHFKQDGSLHTCEIDNTKKPESKLLQSSK